MVAMAATGVLGVVAARSPTSRCCEPRGCRSSSPLSDFPSARIRFEGIYGPGFESYPAVLRGRAFSIGGVGITFAARHRGGGFGVIAALHAFVQRTPMGTAMRALAMDQDAARLMGIDVERVILLTFFFGHPWPPPPAS